MSDSGGGSPRDDDDGEDERPPRDAADETPDRPTGSPPGDSRGAADGSSSSDDARGQPASGPSGAGGEGDGRTDAAEPPRTTPPVAGRAGEPPEARDVPDPRQRPVRWYLRTERPLVVATRDVLSSVLLVVVVGLALFAVSGVWPPLVAVESGSMEDNMYQGDLVLVVEEDRFASQVADEHGIVTRADARNSAHQQFGQAGSVIVFRPNGDPGTPIIHRAVYRVQEDDNWVARADPDHLGNVDECSDIPDRCPAPHDGYITRGDANQNYDQIDNQSTVVKPAWIRGRAVSRTPYLGCIRLALSDGGLCGS